MSGSVEIFRACAKTCKTFVLGMSFGCARVNQIAFSGFLNGETDLSPDCFKILKQVVSVGLYCHVHFLTVSCFVALHFNYIFLLVCEHSTSL
jgi:hypothetical protein